jgi:hypothetical protein
MKYRSLLFSTIFALFLLVSAGFAQDNIVSRDETHPTHSQSQVIKDRFGSLLGGSGLLSALVDEKVRELSESPVFARFDNWLEENESGRFNNEQAHIELGEQLAAERQKVLAQIIALDPQAALEKAVSADDFKRMPSIIGERAGKRISARGDFLVYVVDDIDHSTGEMRGSRTERMVVIGGIRYKAAVYGRREAMTTKLDIPLQGVVVGETFVVDESPVRVLSAEERAARTDVDSLSSAQAALAAEVGGRIVGFSGEAQLKAFVNQQISDYRTE